MTIIRPTTINARFSHPVGLGGEKLWLCPTLGGDRLDLSGNGNHGTYNGGIETVADKFKGSRAYSFNGIDGYIDCPSVLPIVSDLISNSISFWYRQETLGNDPDFMGTKGGGTNGWRMELQVFSPANDRNLSLKSFRVTNYSLNTAPDDTNWHHVTLNVDSSRNGQWFFDGDALGSSFTVLQAGQSVSEFSIGRIPGVSVTNAVYLDDIRIYDRILSAGEVKHLASYRGVLGSPRQPYDPLKRTVVRVPAAIPAATVVGSIRKPTTIIKPSYQSGYARNASESENPNLWDGLVSWVPSLGSSGSTVRCIQDKSRGIKNDGVTFSGSSEQSLSNGAFLSFDGSDDYMRIYDSSLKNVGGLNPDECLAVRFRRRSLTGTTALFGYLSAGFLGAYGRGFYFDGTTMHCMSEQNNNTPPITSTVNDNKWHVAIANFGANGSFYLDGKLIGTGSLRFSWNYWLQLASASAHVSPPGNAANAAVDVSVAYQWDRLLTVGEIKKISVDSLAPFRRKQRVSVAVPAAVTPSATYHPLRSLAHPLEQ